MKALGKFLAVLVAVAIIALPVIGVYKLQAIEDWLKLRGYTPPGPVAQLATEDTMTAEGRHIFYVNHPVLYDDVKSFRKNCSQTEQTIVLGCYHPDQAGIAVYNVSDNRLNGVREVTAAHEMLHAAYDRLDSKTKNQVNAWLQDYYKNDLKDQRIIDTINSYKTTEPNDVVNEMHSVFGTEVPSLPAPLENYYKQYFTSRGTVAAFAQSYEAEFTSRLNEISANNARLASLKAQIDNEGASLDAQLAQINSDRAELDNLKASGNYQQYNAKVGGFNAEVGAYNNGVARLKSDIDVYNQLVNSQNDVIVQLRSLYGALDTRLQTAQPSQ